MRHPPLPVFAAAGLVAALVVGHLAWTTTRGTLPVSAQLQPALSQEALTQLEHCRRHVYLVHDVHWAAACSRQTPDDTADCTLPEQEAAPLNAALDRAEARCLAEARASR